MVGFTDEVVPGLVQDLVEEEVRFIIGVTVMFNDVQGVFINHDKSRNDPTYFLRRPFQQLSCS